MKSKFFIILLLLLSIPGCDFFTDPEDDSNSTEKIVMDNGIEHTLSVSKNVMSLRDTLTVTFSIKNNSTAPKTYNFANVQQLGFNITDKSNRTVISYPMIVSPALSNFTVHPGETKRLTVRSLLKNSEGYFIPTGHYILKAYLLDRNSPQLTLRITVQ